MNKKPGWLTDESYYGHPKNHLLFLVLAAAAIIVAVPVFLLTFSMQQEWLKAEIRQKVTATLVDIREAEEEKWEYVESAGEARTPQERATRTYTSTFYSYDWEYELNGEKLIWNISESSGTVHKIGDTMELLFWSNDGKEYHRSNHSSTSTLIMWASVIVCAVALYLILRIIYIKLRLKSKKNKKRS